MFLSSTITTTTYLPTLNNKVILFAIMPDIMWFTVTCLVFINSIFLLMLNAIWTLHVTINQHCYCLHWQLFESSCLFYILLLRPVQSLMLSVSFVVLEGSFLYSWISLLPWFLTYIRIFSLYLCLSMLLWKPSCWPVYYFPQ